MTPQNPVAQPLGGATVSGTKVTVDTYVNPPTKIPARIRNLVEANQGYFIERVLGQLGSQVQGGAVVVEESFPEDFFLPDDESVAPRAPGSEAPRLGSSRNEPKVKRPESWSGSIEVTDEARQRNNILAVQRQFTQAANTFAHTLQLRGIAVIKAAIESWERDLESQTKWTATPAEGMPNVDPADLPTFDIANVIKTFEDDKVGVLPDTVILPTTEMLYLRTLFPGYGTFPSVERIFADHGITNVYATPMLESGEVIFCKAGAPGVMAWELPLSQEKERIAARKTDLYVLETRPVYAMHDASAILRLTKTDE